MQKKFLNKEEFEKTYKQGEKLSFQSKSPFSAITDPKKKIIFFATHYNKLGRFVISGTTGTAYACCVGDSDVPIKFYAYSLKIDADGSGPIIDIEKPILGYHHVKQIEDIPNFIKDQMPVSLWKQIIKIFKFKV